jgi:hypothetical protein
MNNRKWIIISAIVVASIGILLLVLDMAISMFIRLSSLSYISSIKRDDIPIQIVTLQDIQTKSGYDIDIYGFKFTLSGYEHAELISNKDDMNNMAAYMISEDKRIIVWNSYKRRAGDISFNSLNYSTEDKKRMEKASGRKVESVSDFQFASLLSKPSDFSIFDYEKNLGLKILIEAKYSFLLSSQFKRIDIIDSDEIKGTI